MPEQSEVYCHELSLCESENVGSGSRIWAYAHILSGAKIGTDANICDHVFIENDVIIGNRVTIKSFVALWDGVKIDDEVFIGPGVTFTNDPYPRSKRYIDSYPVTVVAKGASIGGGAVLLPGLHIGEFSMVAAGSVVTKNVEPFSLVVGNPALPVGMVCRCGAPLEKIEIGYKCSNGDWHGERPFAEMGCSCL